MSNLKEGGEDDVALIERLSYFRKNNEFFRYASLGEIDRLLVLAHRGVSAPTAEAAAWSYELKYTTGGEYTDQWLAPQLTFIKPCVPKDAVRNLTSLYTHPQAAPAATGAVTDEMVEAAYIAWLNAYGYDDGRRRKAMRAALEAALAATPSVSTPDGGCTTNAATSTSELGA